jgi:hypothetical protein
MRKEAELLKAAMKGKKAVSVNRSILGTAVRHYETNIFVESPGRVVLSSGGLFSVTTKRYINDCFAALGMNASVYQRKNVWYVESNGLEQVFFDGMFVNW